MHDLLAALDRELPKGSEARPRWAIVQSQHPLGLDLFVAPVAVPPWSGNNFPWHTVMECADKQARSLSTSC